MTIRRWVCLALGCVLMGVPPHTWAQAALQGPSWVGQNTLIYVEVEQPTALIEQLTSDHFQTYIYAVPAYKRYVKGKDYRDIRAGVAMVSGLLNTTWDQALRKVAGNGIVVAVDAVNGKAQIVLIATPTDPKFLKESLTTIVGLTRDDAKDKGNPDPIQQVDYRGVTGYGVGDYAVAIVRDCLIIGNSGDAIKALIDRVEDQPENSLIKTKEYQDRKADASAAKEKLAWGYAQLEGLRKVDPKRFTISDKLDAGQILLFGSWIETLKQASWIGATLTWKDLHLGASLTMPAPKNGFAEPLKTYIPPTGQGAATILNPPGTIASMSLWRDLSKVWDVRNDLFNIEYVQSLAGLDTFAGQFFGAKDFGSGVLAALTSDWRLVVAHQDYAKLNPSPDLKLPGFAIVIGLKEADDEFAQRLRSGFQTFVGLANLGFAQAQSPPLELSNEMVDGINMSTAKFMPSKAPVEPGSSVHNRFNISPSSVQVGNQFVISSTASLARDLVKTLHMPGKPTDETLVIEADGSAVASLVTTNRTRLVMQNMIEKGNAKPASEEEIDTMRMLLDYLGKGRLSVKDGEKAWEMHLDFLLHPVKY